jgi:hypothetical protein
LKLVQAKNPSPKRAVEVAQGESSEFKPQYHKEKKKKKLTEATEFKCSKNPK